LLSQSTLDGTRGTVVNSSISRGTKSTDKEKKIGHRRVGEDGEITYKKIQTSTIMGSIQLGIQHTVSDLRGIDCLTVFFALNKPATRSIAFRMCR
jgi:hypothetical protein